VCIESAQYVYGQKLTLNIKCWLSFRMWYGSYVPKCPLNKLLWSKVGFSKLVVKRGMYTGFPMFCQISAVSVLLHYCWVLGFWTAGRNVLASLHIPKCFCISWNKMWYLIWGSPVGFAEKTTAFHLSTDRAYDIALHLNVSLLYVVLSGKVQCEKLCGAYKMRISLSLGPSAIDVSLILLSEDSGLSFLRIILL
jgi:hypothetical protein